MPHPTVGARSDRHRRPTTSMIVKLVNQVLPDSLVSDWPNPHPPKERDAADAASQHSESIVKLVNHFSGTITDLQMLHD